MSLSKLTFSVLLSFVLASCAATKSPELAPRSVAGIEGVCEIHHVQMRKKSVQIVHGLLVLSPVGVELERAKKKLFPHAVEQQIVSSDEPGEVEVFECSECEKAKDRWIMSHPEKAHAKKG